MSPFDLAKFTPIYHYINFATKKKDSLFAIRGDHIHAHL